MQYINHALQPETTEDHELLATVDNIIGTINSYRYKTSIYTDGVGTTRPEYGIWLHRVQLMAALLTEHNEISPYVEIAQYSRNAYPNNPDWCRRYAPERSTGGAFTYNGVRSNIITVIVIKRGLDYFNIIDTEYDDKRVYKTTERLLTEDAKHRVRIVKVDQNKVNIYTNKTSTQFIDKITQLRYTLFDSVGPVYLAENAAAHAILKAAANEDVETTVNCMRNLVEQHTEIMQRRLWNSVQTALNSARTKNIRSYKDRLTRLSRDIDSYAESYRQLLAEQHDTQLKYNALVNTPEDTTTLEALRTCINNTPNIRLVDITNNADLVIEFKTVVCNYRHNDVAFWYKNPNVANTVTQYSDVAKVIKALFLTKDEDYKLHLTTRITVPIATDGRGWASTNQPNDAIANPHIKYYNCFRASQLETQKYIADQQFDMAFACLTAACGTITFTDSTVVRRFVEDIRNAIAENKIKCVENTDTGEMLTLTEFYNKLIEEENNAPDNVE